MRIFTVFNRQTSLFEVPLQKQAIIGGFTAVVGHLLTIETAFFFA